MLATRAIRHFFKRAAKEAETSQIVKLAKDPKLFQNLHKIKETADQKADKEYKETLKNYARVAESRKNMRIDLRPSVLSRTMTKELMLVFIVLCALIGKWHKQHK